MKLIENKVVVLEDDAEQCVRFFDEQKDAEGWPRFFDVQFCVYVNGKRRAASYSFAGILEESFAIKRRFPFAEKREIRMVRIQQDDPCISGAIMIPEFSSLTFRDDKTAIMDGAEWQMRFKSLRQEKAEAEAEAKAE